MLQLTEISKKFQNNVILDHVNLHINKGDILGVIGPSGSGKSTLLRCINLLEIPESGKIKIGDFELNIQEKKKKDVIELRKKTAMVFQQFNLFRQKTALENVMEGLVVVKKMAKDRAREIGLEQLRKVGLSDRINHYPKQLSGGQQQRVAIARALAMAPDILLFDEPTSALDPELVGEVLDSIRAAAAEGNTMILVSHEMNFVRNVANRVIFLEGGRIIEDGLPKEVFENPKSERAREFLTNFYKSREPEYII